MSWASNFAKSFLGAFLGTGGPAITPTHPDQAPLVNALNATNQAGTDLGAALTTAADATLEGYLATKVGPVPAEIADLALHALIQSAASRLSGSTAQAAASAAIAPTSAGNAQTTGQVNN